MKQKQNPLVFDADETVKMISSELQEAQRLILCFREEKTEARKGSTEVSCYRFVELIPYTQSDWYIG